MAKLPTAEQTGLPAQAISSANSAVERVLEVSSQLGEGADRAKRKRKYAKTFTPEDCANIGQYAAENGVSRAQSHFKSLDLSESSVRYFKKT